MADSIVVHPSRNLFSNVGASRREWLIALAVALVTAVLLITPYLLGHWLARPGTVYTGLLINVEDGTYLSAIEQGRQGAWAYRNFFTTEAHNATFIQGYYLALGHAARLLGLSAVAMWHLALLLANLILFLLLFAFISFALPGGNARWVAYLLALFGSGFDLWPFPAWLERAAALDAVPVTLRMPEAHIFFSALTYPHFSAWIILIMALFWLTFRALTLPDGNRRRWPYALLAGGVNLLLGIVYPFLIFLITAVFAAFYLFLTWRARRLLWRELALLALIYLVSAPLFLYYQLALSANPVLQAWSAQAVTLSPNPLHYLLTYAPYLVLALPGLPLLRQRDWPRRDLLIFLWLWVAVVAVLLYMPLNPQRRFVQGVQVPLAILAAAGFCHVLLPRFRQSRLVLALAQRPRYSVAGLQRLLTIFTIIVAGLVNFYLLLGALITLVIVQPYPFFRPQAEMEALAWLRANSDPEAVVLAAYWTGSYLAYAGGRRTVVGHRYETVGFEQKRREVEQYYQPATDDWWRQELLRRYDVSYIFAGPAERDLGGFDPGRQAGLEPVFDNGAVIIYRAPSPVDP